MVSGADICKRALVVAQINGLERIFQAVLLIYLKAEANAVGMRILPLSNTTRSFVSSLRHDTSVKHISRMRKPGVLAAICSVAAFATGPLGLCGARPHRCASAQGGHLLDGQRCRRSD